MQNTSKFLDTTDCRKSRSSEKKIQYYTQTLNKK
jgi:hypothetical protein